jgi:glutamate dehydrogenase
MSDLPIKEQLVARIQAVARRSLAEPEISQFENYLDQLVQIHTDQAFLEWKDESLYGVHYGLYRETQKRQPTEALVRVFNPHPDLDGWHSHRTIIYFCHTDIPFLVDSLRMALNRLDLNIQLFESNPLRVLRNAEGCLLQVCESANQDAITEDHGFIVVDAMTDQTEHLNIREEVLTTIGHVSIIVSDFQPMLEHIDEVIAEYSQLNSKPNNDSDLENLEFLHWLRDGNFTFLGSADFRFVDQSSDSTMCELSDSRLGLLKIREKLPDAKISSLSRGFADFYKGGEDLAFAKSSVRSTVHRDTYPDYVVVKRYEGNRVIGETRFLGLYTARLYHLSIEQIPLVRKKAKWLLEQSRFNPTGHNGKAYISILEGHPRDELIQGRLPDLLETTLSIWKIYERRTVKLFIRFGAFQKFVSCIVYIPRESLRTETREKIEQLLSTAFDARSSEYTTQFLAESVLARIHYVFRVTNETYLGADPKRLEDSIVEIVHDWSDRFVEVALSRWGEEKGTTLSREYKNAFPAAYKDQMPVATAVQDLELFHPLADNTQVAMSFYPANSSDQHIVGLKLFRRDLGIELSDMIPMLEHLGFRVLVDHPYKICPKTDNPVWMQDFTLSYQCGDCKLPDISAIRQPFERAFHAIWKGEAENDECNRLVIAARLDWRQVNLLRAYASYLKQLGSSLSAKFIAETMLRYTEITKQIVQLFFYQFEPGSMAEEYSEEGRRAQIKQIEEQLEQVESINEDQVFRIYLQLIQATLRTNYFCRDEVGNNRPCLSLKLATRQILTAPEPRPAYEIFVYSARVEGLHLRGGKVARGGIRWSDRFEDYRTEVLGLVKAQQVKNAVIVPAGAKGGFIARASIGMPDRESFLQEGLACYRLFISSLLDITDNRIDGRVVRPPLVRARDDDDPYLVVAADKGTATYSDEANAISADYGHWLGDAFASGGSQGYDHKKMGITARGAWVAVQRHFRELGTDIQNELFTVVAIGDMAGDVFGNGMLLSRKIQLLAAFNHMHIFIDPNPDAESSWKERKRLFDLPRSSWQDYSEKLISKGGGVFLRSAKRISISKEMASCFGISEATLQPDQLIRSVLAAKVDLIWNGGIGTYVKSSKESHQDVGDRGSESLRLNGNELQARVFGEGGNLGMTQLGRIEFCQNGGVCNTDFIDNAAGVDCSDHEVNIKILLNEKVATKQISYEQRNGLLEAMTEGVSALVLRNNYLQTLAISLAHSERQAYHFDYLRFLNYLEANAGLNRELEFLPDDESIKELNRQGLSWARPELAVLVSYAKVDLKNKLLLPEIADDPALKGYVMRPFPQQLQDQYAKEIQDHQLRREIVSTQIANELVNRMGFAFCFRLNESVGASIADIARAYALVHQIFDLDAWWQDIEALDYSVDAKIQHQMFHQIMRLTRRCTRWFLRNSRGQDTETLAQRVQEKIVGLVTELHLYQSKRRQQELQTESQKLIEAGVPAKLAQSMANIESSFLLPGIVLSATDGRTIEHLLEIQFKLADLLGIDWLMEYLVDLNPENQWQDLAKEAYFFDLETLLRVLATKLCKTEGEEGSSTTYLKVWQAEQSVLIERFRTMMKTIQDSESRDLSMLTVAISDLKDIVNSSAR